MLSAAEFIRRHEADILQGWLEDASLAASARGLERPEFTTVMPKYVAALGGAADLGDFAGSRRKHVESHLASRIRQGFAIEEIVDEFLLLGRCVERVVRDERTPPAERPDANEMDRLWTELHRAAAAATDVFTKHMAEDEQAEKRYLRLLRTIANAALKKSQAPFRERLDEVLALIMESMGASSAALSLYRADTKELVSAATAGAEGMEEHVASLGLSSFAGQIASSEGTTELEDVATTQLDVPDTLRRSGVHSLLGVRLPARHTLIGVLYVGLREKREFTARETRRLEAIGEQLTVHLDNAALFAELTASVEALRTERQLRDHFVSVLAHDLRGPLSAAKVAVQVLLQRSTEAPGPVDALRSELERRIERNIDRTDRMVRDLLDANRLHAGERLPLHLAECDLTAIARETIEELTSLHGERFVLQGDERVIGIWSADELRRSLWNLAANAVKYGAPGRPVTITIRTVKAEPPYAELSVHNEGAPIPVEEQAQIFLPFARARAVQTEGPSGWGLGLALVDGCAEAHGGRVTLKSDAITGTTFTFELPLDARPYQPTSGQA